MSVQVMSWVFQSAPPDMDPAETLVALTLAEHANAEGGMSYPSVKTISRLARLSERHVTRALGSLVSRGVITVEFPATNKRPTVYRFPVFRGDTASGQKTSRDDVMSSPKTDRGDMVSELGVTPCPIRGDTMSDKPSREPSVGTVTPPAPPGGRAKARKQIPDDWTLTPELRRYAVEHGIPEPLVDDFAEEFRLYWLGEGRPKSNWNQAFQGRVRDKGRVWTAQQARARGLPTSANGHLSQSEIAESQRRVREALGQA